MNEANPQKKIEYAELIDRIKAAFSDMVVLVILMYAATTVLSSFEYVPIEARIAAFVGIFFIYEPLFISAFGGTIGHYVNGLRVKRSKDYSKNIIFPWAIVRYAAKIFLGIISLFTISSNFEGKAMHDMIVNSVVIKK